ncbi:MAG: CHAD domain-containing protein [Ornithinibacter sp.]
MRGAVELGADAEARKSRAVTLDATLTASEAFVAVATECTEHWRTNAGLLLRSRAMPHLHQTRVGIRRLRTSFSLFRPLLREVPGAFFMAHRVRGLALPFGRARDLDVLLSGPLVDDLDDEQVDRLVADREAAYDVAHAILRSPDWADAARSLDGLVLLAPWHGVPDPPVRDLAAQALEKRWHRVVGHVDRLAAMPPTDRHRVRIEAKKLRYGCEFFASLYATDVPTVETGSGEQLSGPLAFAWHVEQVQTALGAVNDHHTADGLLRAVGSAAPRVDEHRLVDGAVEAVRTLRALDPFWH